MRELIIYDHFEWTQTKGGYYVYTNIGIFEICLCLHLCYVKLNDFNVKIIILETEGGDSKNIDEIKEYCYDLYCAILSKVGVK